MTLRIGALISGGGRTVLNLLDRIDAGALDAEIPVVIASRPDAKGIERLRARGVTVLTIGPRTHPGPGAADDAITRTLVEHDVGLVCLCGYLRKLRIEPPFTERVINIHPALLPDFGGRGMYGDHVHRAVLAAGRTESGCTVHFVDDEYDHGPTILQRTCPVLPGDDPDTLAARVFAEECVAYVDAIELFIEGRVRLVDGRVEIDGCPVPGSA